MSVGPPLFYSCVPDPASALRRAVVRGDAALAKHIIMEAGARGDAIPVAALADITQLVVTLGLVGPLLDAGLLDARKLSPVLQGVWLRTAVYEDRDDAALALLKAGFTPDIETKHAIVATCDTDLVLIGALNAFEGLRVRLTHFDHITKLPVHMWVDCARLAKEGPARYGVTLMEFATLVASKGTDYVGSVIHGVGDFDVYLAGCASALKDVKRARGGRPLVTDDRVEAGALHTVFVAASERMKRARLKYDRDDGAMARLAWNVLYFRNAVQNGGEGLDCAKFGWRFDQGKVAVGALAPAAFSYAPGRM